MIEGVRKHFPILNQNDGVVYLDNAATTLKPKVVIDSVVDYYSKYTANVHRGDFFYAHEANRQYENTRSIVKDFINAKDEKEIIFTFGTTHGFNLLAHSLCERLKPKDEILISNLEHSSNMIVWQILAKRKDLVLKVIPCDQEGNLSIDEYKKLVTDKTKIVSVIHISSVLGVINPIKTMAKIAHDKNAFFLVDAAQSVGHQPIDVQDLGVDFLLASSHKICGPTGVGFLYGKKEFLEDLPVIMSGGGGVYDNDLDKTVFADLPNRLEVGTPSIEGTIGFGSAIKFLMGIGLDNIKKAEIEFWDEAMKLFADLDFIKMYTHKQSKVPIFSFEFEGVHSHDVGHLLNEEKIAVRTGKHCSHYLLKTLGVDSFVRASFYFYNTLEDVKKLIKALYKTKEIMNV